MNTWLFHQHSTWKVLSMEKSMHRTQTYNFQSILHGDAKTWADAGSLKVKYLVNAENFIPGTNFI